MNVNCVSSDDCLLEFYNLDNRIAYDQYLEFV